MCAAWSIPRHCQSIFPFPWTTLEASMFLRHLRLDIPSLAAEASKEHSDVPYIVTSPLGLHELMVDVMNDRIKYCLRHVAGDADECTVCAGTGKCRLYS